MPELPEIETIKNELRRVIVGKTIADFWCDSKKQINYPVEKYKKIIKGKKILEIQRRAKNLIIQLSAKYNLLAHLKLTGQLIYLKNQKELKKWKYTHIIFYFTDKSFLIFNDVRKFGYIKIYSDQDLAKEIEKIHLGTEPLAKEFTYQKFKELLAKRPNNKIKLFLMDQSLISGIGNIYANEILFAAKILPTRLVKILKEDEIKKIFVEIKNILIDAIKHKGSSVDDYLDAKGKKGGYDKLLKVYGKKGKPCPRCGRIIKRISLGQRGTFFCPKCQK